MGGVGTLVEEYNSGVITQLLKEAVPYIRGLWTAVGPLLGVLVGAFLARSWDKKKWMNDNRKEEFRELITALMNAAAALIMQQIHANEQTIEMDEEENAQAMHLEAIKVMKTRIFIANDVKAMHIYERWTGAIKEMRKTKAVGGLEDTFETLTNELVERAKG
jgi:hypothetical protein